MIIKTMDSEKSQRKYWINLCLRMSWFCKGREKFMGLSPCQTPLETADIGFVHIFDDPVPLLFKAEEVDISRMHICREVNNTLQTLVL